MSWVFLVSLACLVLAVVFIEYRALRAGDERGHPVPGHDLVMVGLIAVGIGIAAAVSEQTLLALLASSVGLVTVIAGAFRHAEASAH